MWPPIRASSITKLKLLMSSPADWKFWVSRSPMGTLIISAEATLKRAAAQAMIVRIFSYWSNNSVKKLLDRVRRRKEKYTDCLKNVFFQLHVSSAFELRSPTGADRMAVCIRERAIPRMAWDCRSQPHEEAYGLSQTAPPRRLLTPRSIIRHPRSFSAKSSARSAPWHFDSVLQFHR